MPPLCAGVVAALGALSLPTRASAVEAQPFRMMFSSTTSCLDPSEFVAEVLRRSTRLRTALSGEAGVTFVVELTDSRSGTQGQLRVQYPDGSISERGVPGANCHEVLSAMALIAVLMVETEGPPAPALPRRRSLAPSEPTPRAEKEPEPRLGLSFAVGQRLRAESGPLPAVAFGESVHAEFGYAFSAFWHPAARLSGLVATKEAATSTKPSIGSGQFVWRAARVAVCPVTWSPWRRLSVRPCLYGEAGRLHAQGYDTENANEANVTWVAGGVELALELALLGPLTLGAEVGVRRAVSPAPGEQYFFKVREPDLTVFTVPSAGLSAGLGLGLRFF